MKNQRTNSWKHHTGNDTIFNGGLIAAGIVGLLLAVIQGPMPNPGTPSRPVMLAGLVLSEIAPASNVVHERSMRLRRRPYSD